MSREFSINSTIGEYRITDFLGMGGMGEVYRAVHNKIGRVVAIKVLTNTAASEIGHIERFFNEARIQASLQHPNIATLYDFLEVNNQPCIIMEYIDGQTVSERVRAYGALPLDETLHILIAVTDALNYVHMHGVIHRDIKSNNIKISSTGQVKLLDFGIAKAQLSPGLTATGSVIGTLEYISPEQLMGGHADARSDIWALGVLLFEMVTGDIPFQAQTLGELCDKINKAQYPNPEQLNPNVPRETLDIIARCLRRDPAERYQTAHELLQNARHVLYTSTAPVLHSNAGHRNSIQAAHHTTGLNITPSSNSGSASVSTQQNVSHRKWGLLAGGVGIVVVMLVFVIGIGLYMLTTDNNKNTTDERATNVKSGNEYETKIASPPPSAKKVQIDVSEGRAQIWRNGQMVGETPYKLNASIGEHVNLTLKREGFSDKNVDFDVGANQSILTFSMENANDTFR
ncbi:MAG: hypothetical protein NVSMB56_02830 [Pyrinomonadaceae bacterium]